MPLDNNFDFAGIATREALQELQLERLKWSLAHAYEGNPRYRAKFDAAGVALRANAPDTPRMMLSETACAVASTVSSVELKPSRAASSRAAFRAPASTCFACPLAGSTRIFAGLMSL